MDGVLTIIVKKIVAINVEFSRKIILWGDKRKNKISNKNIIISWQGYKFSIIYLKEPWQNIVKRILLYVLIKREFNPQAERLNIND